MKIMEKAVARDGSASLKNIIPTRAGIFFKNESLQREISSCTGVTKNTKKKAGQCPAFS